MPRHPLEPGEHISMIAAVLGFKNWQTIWDANPSLKSKRKNPNVLFHGDRVSPADVLNIPELKVEDTGGSTGKKHKFKIPDQKLFLRLRILTERFTAIANADYELTVPGVADPFKGKTDGQGQISVEIPRQTTTAQLIVRVPAPATDTGGSAPPAGAVRGPVPVTWNLQVGALNPIMESASSSRCIAGVQQRLNNMCLNTGPVDGMLGPNTKAAVKAFQNIFGLKEDGIPGQGETQPKMKKVHDDPDSVLGPAPAPPPT